MSKTSSVSAPLVWFRPSLKCVVLEVALGADPVRRIEQVVALEPEAADRRAVEVRPGRSGRRRRTSRCRASRCSGCSGMAAAEQVWLSSGRPDRRRCRSARSGFVGCSGSGCSGCRADRRWGSPPPPPPGWSSRCCLPASSLILLDQLAGAGLLVGRRVVEVDRVARGQRLVELALLSSGGAQVEEVLGLGHAGDGLLELLRSPRRTCPRTSAPCPLRWPWRRAPPGSAQRGPAPDSAQRQRGHDRERSEPRS